MMCTLYTNTCKKGKEVALLLIEAKIDYQTVRCIEKIQTMAKAYNMNSIPFLLTENGIPLDYNGIKKYIREEQT
jgi:GTPase SAR1 family protein